MILMMNLTMSWATTEEVTSLFQEILGKMPLSMMMSADWFDANYFAQAGITSFACLTEYDHTSWNKLQERLTKNCRFTVALDHQIKSLIAISLWVNMRIVHGTFENVDTLTRQDVKDIVRQEGCVEVPHTMVKPTKLGQQSDYPTWKKQMRIHLESVLNKEFLRLSYIIHPIAHPATFHNLTHEVESVIVNDGATAQSMRDSKLVYSILYANTTDTSAKSYMENGNELQCGRTAWFSVESLYEGSGNNERLISEIQLHINRQSYTMHGQGMALPLTKRLFG